MEDKCPKCGTTLTIKTIKKELGLGSIDFPVTQSCPGCGWNRDLTGAGDVITKPFADIGIKKAKEEKQVEERTLSSPRKDVPSNNFNKIITVALALIVLGGIVWAFAMSGQKQQIKEPESPAAPIGTIIPAAPAATELPLSISTDVTPTGRKIPIKLNYYRGFLPASQKIKPGDEVIWENYEVETLTLVSDEGIFEQQLLSYGRQYRNVFKKPGTYTFHLKDNSNLTGIIIVES